MNLKILFWIEDSFDHHTTSEHLLTAVIKSLCENGHTVHIIQQETGGTLPLIPEELSGCAVTTDAVPFRQANKRNFIARYLADLKYIRSCRKYIAPGYDAVFIQSNNEAGFAVRMIRSKLPKAAITFNAQDIFPYNAVFSGVMKKNSIVFRVLAAVQRYGYRHADHVITISEDMKETLVSDGVPADKIEVVYNWSYQDELYEGLDLTPAAHMFSSRYDNVVYAGNIGVMQNVDILVEAARLLKNEKSVWFHIIGSGVHKEKIESKAAEYGITNITFWPMQPPEMAPLIYSAADVNVIPLMKDVYRTALPSKTATCLACRKPIIFAIGKESQFGQRMVNEACCQVVEPDNAAELAEAIRNVQSGKTAVRTGEFFLKYCGKTENSQKYARIITKRRQTN